MTNPSDFTRYQGIQEQMRAMIREGKYNYLTFQDLWEESEAIVAAHGGMPPEPPDMDALEQELVEAGVEKGLR